MKRLVWLPVAAVCAGGPFSPSARAYSPSVVRSAGQYSCGTVPRETLVAAGWAELNATRCPRGQDGDQQPGESFDPTELEFLACGLVSNKKFVVWTPHVFLKTDKRLGALLEWARAHTTCDFSLVEMCPNGTFVILDGEDGMEKSFARSRGHCVPEFDVTTQPLQRRALAGVALQLFEATAKDRGVDELSPLEAEMAFGVVLGYPKYATRAYQEDPPRFEQSYMRAVSWLLRRLPQGSQVYARIAAWPTSTNHSALEGLQCSVMADSCAVARCATPPAGCSYQNGTGLVYDSSGRCCPKLCQLSCPLVDTNSRHSTAVMVPNSSNSSSRSKKNSTLMSNMPCFPEMGPCMMAKCRAPPTGCSYKLPGDLVFDSFGRCCPKLCQLSCTDVEKGVASRSSSMSKNDSRDSGAMSNISCVSEAGPCIMARCQAPPRGCSYKLAGDLVSDGNGKCCPKPCQLLCPTQAMVVRTFSFLSIVAVAGACFVMCQWHRRRKVRDTQLLDDKPNGTPHSSLPGCFQLSMPGEQGMGDQNGSAYAAFAD